MHIASTHAFVVRRKCVSGTGGTISGDTFVETIIIGGKTQYTYIGGGRLSGTDETEDVRAARQFMLTEANQT